METIMSSPKIIDVSQFEVANKEDMDKFNDVLTKVIVAIAQVSKQLNSTSKLSIEKVTDRKNWDMKDFTPKSGRAAAKMSLQSETPNAKTASILTHLKDRLNDCKPSNKTQKELIELLKGRLVFLGIQSASKIAELAALDHISKIEKSLNNSSDLKSTDDIELLSELPANLKILSHLIKKYSIDTLTDHSPREKYTSDDIGKHNTKVLNLYDKTRKLINTLSQTNIISKDMREESIDFLNDSRMCFQHKSNINFDFPTKDPTKKVVRNLSALGLGLVSLTSAVAATACTAVSVSGVTAPATAPAAIGLSLISAGSGGAALSMTALNSAINYWMYDISPSKNEKIGMALGAT